MITGPQATAVSSGAAVTPDVKLIGTLRARLALADQFALDEMPLSAYVGRRWNWTCPCANFDEVEAFARRVEAIGDA